jgi:hypothetical protein
MSDPITWGASEPYWLQLRDNGASDILEQEAEDRLAEYGPPNSFARGHDAPGAGRRVRPAARTLTDSGSHSAAAARPAAVPDNGRGALPLSERQDG